MKKTTAAFLSRKKRMLVAFSGIACAIPFVFPYAFFLPWIAYTPLALLFFEKDASVRDVFRGFFAFGFCYYLVGVSFLVHLYPMTAYGFDELQSLLILAAALAGIPALFALLLALCAAGGKYAVLRLRSDVPALLLFPCVFVLTEWLQSLGPLAFPWCRVFVTQGALPLLYQIGAVLGSYALTFAVPLAGAFFAISVKRRDGRFLAFGAAVYLVLFCYGACRFAVMESHIGKGTAFNAAALQGNYNSNDKWSVSAKDAASRYLSLAGDAEAGFDPALPAIVVTPETAIPATLDDDGGLLALFRDHAAQKNETLAVGAFRDEENGYANVLFWINPDGSLAEPYRKRHLVPFGEFLPFRGVLETVVPSLADMNMFAEDLVSGGKAETVETPVGTAGSLICFDSVFPSLARENAGDILVIATNDSWFENSPALAQHLSCAVMRAVENGVPVIRAANTGISALIESDGRVTQMLGEGETGFAAGVLHVSRISTLYRAVGDALACACIAFWALCVAFAFLRERRRA